MRDARRIDSFFAAFRRLPKAELHIHLEGCLTPRSVAELARRCGSATFPDAASVSARRRPGSGGAFLAFYRDVCGLLKDPGDYSRAARDLVSRLSREGIAHAEVYVSPAVVERIGLRWPDIVAAVEPVLARHERRTGGRVVVLLDSVRHWGPAVAHRVLDLHAATPWPRVGGFGMGGDEASVPARAFAAVYRRVRALGLVPLVHAGEWAGAESVAEALEHLAPRRIAHGVRAVEDRRLVARLARLGTALDVCPTSNAATGALAHRPAGGLPAVLELLAAGVVVTLSTDDPGLFGTTLLREYRELARLGATPAQLRRVVRNGLAARVRG